MAAHCRDTCQVRMQLLYSQVLTAGPTDQLKTNVTMNYIHKLVLQTYASRCINMKTRTYKQKVHKRFIFIFVQKMYKDVKLDLMPGITIFIFYLQMPSYSLTRYVFGGWLLTDNQPFVCSTYALTVHGNKLQRLFLVKAFPLLLQSTQHQWYKVQRLQV